MTNALPLRVFLASPGDLEDERTAVRTCFDEHAARRVDVSEVSYEPVDWDRVRATVRRPQAAINELIAESHFMIVMFKGKWGSAPGSPWGYTSGTEEELFFGLLELAQSEQPMRDIWVAFVDDPNPDRRIVSLRQQFIDSHAAMFESISSLADLKTKLTDRLKSWEEYAITKIPHFVELVPSSGREVLKAANLRIRGEKLVELGQIESGRKDLAEAAVLGGPAEHLANAKFLRRHGDLNGAFVFTERAIGFILETGPLFSTEAADAFSAQAGVLSDQGQHLDAIGRLEHALTLIQAEDAYAQEVLCRILDSLGLARQKIKPRDLYGARRDFVAALGIRRKAGRELEICQSLINLARLDSVEGDWVAAFARAEEVISSLHGSPPSGLYANAEVLAAETRLQQNRPEDGMDHATRALAVNRQIANRKGEAISLLVLGQCCRAAGLRREAEKNAQLCLKLNQSMGNAFGSDRAQWLLDAVLADARNV